MGEFTGTEDNANSPEKLVAADSEVKTGEIPTDVEDVFADGEKGGVPVFNVSKDEFYQNMYHGRKRVRFKSGTSAQQYMAKTKYNRPFMISFDGYTRKIK